MSMGNEKWTEPKLICLGDMTTKGKEARGDFGYRGDKLQKLRIIRVTIETIQALSLVGARVTRAT